MAAALKDQFGPGVPREIARTVAAVWPDFDSRAFLRAALAGYDALSLTQRARQIAASLRKYLPADYPDAIAVLMRAVEQPHAHSAAHGMTGFFYMPHTYFVADFGLDHFEQSMAAQHRLTQLFTAEFSIRPFIEQHPARTLARLAEWATDPNPHVRRLVSEGTRPRLPWAGRLRALQKDPRPALVLLELLKDDPELYVRRSVANHLNDIGKDHPALLQQVARRWLRDASPGREWIVRHALRSAVKRAEPGALALLGYGSAPAARVVQAGIAPARARIGGSVRIACTLEGTAARPADVMVDLVVHYVKASGGSAPKVFKWKALRLGRGEQVVLVRNLSLRQLTTRRHHAGLHRVELQMNGRRCALGEFLLQPAKG